MDGESSNTLTDILKTAGEVYTASKKPKAPAAATANAKARQDNTPLIMGGIGAAVVLVLIIVLALRK